MSPNPLIQVGSEVREMTDDEVAKNAISLEQLKTERKAAVNRLRDEKVFSDYTFQGVRYQADAVSQARIEKARLSAVSAIIGGATEGDLRWHGQAIDFFWIDKENVHQVMDAQTFAAFGGALAAREGLMIAAGDAIKRAIEAAADHAAVEAIDITTGWPS